MAREWFRRLSDLTELRLADMDAKIGVDVQVLSLSTPSLEAVDDPVEAVAAARRVNDYLAKAVAEHPTRFAGQGAGRDQSEGDDAHRLLRVVRPMRECDQRCRHHLSSTRKPGATSSLVLRVIVFAR